VEDVKPVFLEEEKRISTATILRRIFTRIHCEKYLGGCTVYYV
jgi:hypothetical protein